MQTSTTPTTRRQYGLLVVLVAVLGAARAILPRDIPFIQDEPLLVNAALDANEAGQLATTGLVGTRGVAYGPAPTWVYQLYLSITHDIIAIVVLHALVLSAFLGLGIYLIARSDRSLKPALGAFAFVSPFLWFYGRLLWDNPMLIPASAILLGAYACFSSGMGRRYLVGAGIAATFALLTHFMVVPLVLAVGIHFVIAHGRDLLRDRSLQLTVGGIVAFAVIVSLPYLPNMIVGGGGTGDTGPGVIESIAMALSGARPITALGATFAIGSDALPVISAVAGIVSLFSIVVIAYGCVITYRRLTSDGLAANPALGVSVLTIPLFVGMAIIQGLDGLPHYYQGVWVSFFVLWWVGLSALWSRRWAVSAFAIQVTAMVGLIVAMTAYVHVNEGTRTIAYGPTLGNQIEVARDLIELDAIAEPASEAFHPRVFPLALQVLRRLETGDVAAGTNRDVVIVYADETPTSGRIVVVLGR